MAHAIDKGSPASKVNLRRRRGKGPRAPPTLEALRLRPRFPHERPWGVEDPHDHELAIRGFWGRASLRHLRHQVGEPFHRLGRPFLHPGREHPLEVLDALEDRTLCQFRLAADLLEGRGLDQDVARHPLVLERADETLGRLDLAILAVEPELDPFRVPLDDPPPAPPPDIHLVQHGRTPARPPPPRDTLV